MILIKGFVELKGTKVKVSFEAKVPVNATIEEIDAAAQKALMDKFDWDFECEEVDD